MSVKGNSPRVRRDAATRFMLCRPLALCAGCYCAGACAGAYLNVSAIIWGALMTLSGAVFLIRKRSVYMFIALAFVASWTNAALLQRTDVKPSASAEVAGWVCAVNNVNGIRSVVTLKDVTLDGETAHTKLRLYVYDSDLLLSVGERVKLRAKTWIADGATCPGGFDFRRYLARNGVWLCATAKSPVEITGRVESAESFLDILRTRIADRIDKTFGGNATLAKAVLLSDKTDMPDEQRESFQKAGVAHLLAVSGLHISCLALAVGWFLRLLGLGRFAAFFITAPVIAAYVVVIGMPSSAVRALVMYCMVESARVFGRKYDMLTSMSAAFLLLVAPNPLSIMDAGLILSFTAVLGIVIFNPLLSDLLRVKRMKKVKRLLFGAACVSIAAQIGTMPAVATVFGTFNPYATLTNIVLVPLCTFVLPVIAITVIMGFIPGIGQAAVWLANAMLDGMNMLVSGVSRLPGACVYVPAWPFWAIAIFAAVCAIVSPYSAVKLRIKRALLLSPALLMVACVIIVRLSLPQGFAVTFADAGNADSSIVRAEGKTYFIDLGNEGCQSVDYLCYTGQGVDGVFLTHPHSDHCGGLKDLMSVRDIPVIYVPCAWDDYGTEETVAMCEARGTRVARLKAGDEVRLSENVVCSVLCPDEGEHFKKENDSSLVVRIAYGEGGVLMTGDVSSKHEPRDIMPCQIVKASHHGSNDGTSAGLLSEAKPLAVVITSGKSMDNLSKKFLKRLQDANAEIYHTGVNGMVTAVINADGTIDMESFL